MDVTNTTLISWSFGLAALGYLSLMAYLVSFSTDWRSSVNARRMVIAAIASVLWALTSLLSLTNGEPLAFVTAATLDVIRYGAWYAFLMSVLLPRVGENNSRFLGSSTWLPTACWSLVACGVVGCGVEIFHTDDKEYPYDINIKKVRLYKMSHADVTALIGFKDETYKLD